MGHSAGEVARPSGVSVRALHHYDEIRLLHPGERTSAGYRSYDDDVERLHRILGYRELGFGLDEIAALLDGDLDLVDHLKRRRELVLGRVERPRRLLDMIERTREAHAMGIKLNSSEMFEVLGDHDPTEYADEVRERWGGTEANRQSRERASRYTKADWQAMKDEGVDADRSRLGEVHARCCPGQCRSAGGPAGE